MANEETASQILAEVADQSARRRLLRVLLWEAAEQQVSGRPDASRAVDASAFEVICLRLNVDNGRSDLDGHFDVIASMLAKAVAHTQDNPRESYHRFGDLKTLRLGPVVKKIDKAEMPSFLLACATAFRWLVLHSHRDPYIREELACRYFLEELIRTLGVRKVPWTATVLNDFVKTVAPSEENDDSHDRGRIAPIVGDLLMRPGFQERLDAGSLESLSRLRPLVAGYTPTTLDRERLRAIDECLARSSVTSTKPPFNDVHPWAATGNAVFAKLAPHEQAVFMNLARHASTCNASRPSKEWTETARQLATSAIYPALAELLEAVNRALAEVRDPRAPARSMDQYELESENDYRLHGLACAAGATGDRGLAQLLVEAVQAASKVPADRRFTAAGYSSACIRALALAPQPGMQLDMLNRIALRIRWPLARKLSTKLIAEVAKKSGIDPVDAEEAYVPDFGLNSGNRVVAIGTNSAEITVAGDHPRITWRSANGELLKTATALKREQPAAVDTAKQLLSDIEAAIPAQRTRLELLLRDRRTWPFSKWRERYLDHGLLSPLVRRILWTVDTKPTLFVEDAPQDLDGKRVSIGEDAEVTIWHPIGRDVAEVLAWRARLESLAITQPFKQVHREVYVITDAERRTATYSNRFAAHIVKTATLLAIGQTRRWKVSLYGLATLALPQFDVRAEFWSEAAGDGQNHLGGPVYLSTDQVRFYTLNGQEPMQQNDVAPLAFSEVMRDVDLFVGVASVGNDPTWQDGGPDGRFLAYWQNYSFGDLGETAKTRRAVLESLLPRLTKLKDRWKLDDKFLVVRGDIRGYKIHLGSGNILMQPNDQYLCIVPDRSTRVAGGDVFLPFEGDATLSIILSKAFLLAADTKITDPTIRRQINQ